MRMGRGVVWDGKLGKMLRKGFMGSLSISKEGKNGIKEVTLEVF